MNARFLDTNLFVYLATGEARKAPIVESLLTEGCVVSVQVLNELANVATRKFGKPWRETLAFLDMIRDLVEVVPLTVEVHDRGLAIAQRHRLSVYDAMIVAAALAAGCDVLWSEDMQHGLEVGDGLRILDPFRT